MSAEQLVVVLVSIDEAAVYLHRKVRTIRSWANRGFAPDGTRLTVVRDQFTKVRFFRRDEIERIDASRWRRADCWPADVNGCPGST
jgi:hypothetical protein